MIHVLALNITVPQLTEHKAEPGLWLERAVGEALAQQDGEQGVAMFRENRQVFTGDQAA